MLKYVDKFDISAYRLTPLVDKYVKRATPFVNKQHGLIYYTATADSFLVLHDATSFDLESRVGTRLITHIYVMRRSVLFR